MTQKELAAALHVSDRAVSKWERGESLPDVYILSQIADLYGVSVSALIGEIQPPKESKPHYHMFILLLSLALTMAVATLLFSMFMICKVDYPAWMFFVYALPVCSIICIVFTSLWWGILWQGVSVSALIWTLGLSLYLSFELENVSLIFLVCAALQCVKGSLGDIPQVPAQEQGTAGRGNDAGQSKRMTCASASTWTGTPKGRMQRGCA